MGHLDFSISSGMEMKNTIPLKENVNVFSNEKPSSLLGDFTEYFHLKSPVKSILKKIHLSGNEKKKTEYYTYLYTLMNRKEDSKRKSKKREHIDPIEDAIHVLQY